MYARVVAVALILAVRAFAADDPILNEPKDAKDARMGWWRDARFGMFIHWGLYAVPAGEWGGKTNYGEWIRDQAKIPVGEYEKLLGQFNPVKFDAKAWVQMAKDAGMKYITITSKHHDGFCLFDSKETDWDVMSTPFKRDIVKELADACHEAGIELCLYHSIMDWHHPDYLPRREWEAKDRPEGDANYDRYVGYMKAQLKEITTNYGHIGVLWYDGEWEKTWTHERGIDLYKYTRGLDPKIIVNNRVDKGRDGMGGMSTGGNVGDFGTPEQEIPATGLAGVDWETCMTMNDHWGFNAHDKNFKSSQDLIRKLVDIASKGGNFLLNIGPMATGEFPPESVARLKDIGAWMQVNDESIYGTAANPLKETPWGRCTQKVAADGTRTLYLHVFDWPEKGHLRLPAEVGAPEKLQAHLLAAPDKALVVRSNKKGQVVVELPETAPDKVDTVVALSAK